MDLNLKVLFQKHSKQKYYVDFFTSNLDKDDRNHILHLGSFYFIALLLVATVATLHVCTHTPNT